MSEKCEHNTTVTMFVKGYLTVELCTWGCGNILVCEVDPNGTTKTLREIEHPELSALRAEVEALEAAVKAGQVLVLRMYEVYEDPQYRAAFSLLHDHQGKYTGKQWTKEQDVFEALAAAALKARP